MDIRLLSGLWHLLPRQFRQRLYAELTGAGLFAVAPCLPRFEPPFSVVGPLTAPTGIGQAARLGVYALRASGFECSTLDITQKLLQPATEAKLDVREIEEGSGTLLVFAPPPNASRALGIVPARLRRNKLLVGCWVCETTELPVLWKRQARFFHFLTAPTAFSARAIAAATMRPVSLLGHPVDAEPMPPFPAGRMIEDADWVVVGAMVDAGSSASRKNIDGLLDVVALVLERTDRVRFYLKVRDLRQTEASTHARIVALEQSARGRVNILTADTHRADAIAFIDRLDVLLSLSRAEGFGLPYAEAILRGVIVAAPRWGGAAEILTDANSIDLPFRLESIKDSSGLYANGSGLWATADPQTAAEAVVALVARAEFRKRPRQLAPLATLATLANFRECLASPQAVDRLQVGTL